MTTSSQLQARREEFEKTPTKGDFGFELLGTFYAREGEYKNRALVDEFKGHLRRCQETKQAPVPADSNPVAYWHQRIKTEHPKSDPEYWPTALKLQYMEKEILELRARKTLPQSLTPEGDGSDWFYKLQFICRVLQGESPDKTDMQTALGMAQSLKRHRWTAEKTITPLTENNDLIAWEAPAGSGFIRYVTDEKYKKFVPAVQRHYKPFKCSKCSTQAFAQISTDDVTSEMKDEFLKIPVNTRREDVPVKSVNIWTKYKGIL